MNMFIRLSLQGLFFVIVGISCMNEQSATFASAMFPANMVRAFMNITGFRQCILVLCFVGQIDPHQCYRNIVTWYCLWPISTSCCQETCERTGSINLNIFATQFVTRWLSFSVATKKTVPLTLTVITKVIKFVTYSGYEMFMNVGTKFIPILCFPSLFSLLCNYLWNRILQCCWLCESLMSYVNLSVQTN